MLHVYLYTEQLDNLPLVPDQVPFFLCLTVYVHKVQSLNPQMLILDYAF